MTVQGLITLFEGKNSHVFYGGKLVSVSSIPRFRNFPVNYMMSFTAHIFAEEVLRHTKVRSWKENVHGRWVKWVRLERQELWKKN